MAAPKILVVEDELFRRDKFDHYLGDKIRGEGNPFAGIRSVRQAKFDLIFLDGDLGDTQMTGWDVACCMYGTANLRATIVIHSMNSVLAKQMLETLVDMGARDVRLLPYSTGDFWSQAVSIAEGLAS